MQGDGAFAIFFTSFFGDEQTRGVIFQANNLSGFQSTVSDVCLDIVAHDTLLVGHSGSVVDLGIDNLITGATPIGAAIGPELRAAHMRKRELLRGLQDALIQ